MTNAYPGVRATFCSSPTTDHLRDYVDRAPDSARVVQQLAAFLAEVEDRPHDHADDPKRGLG
jgi:hypothetical protein